MGMQLLLLILCRKEHLNQVRIWEIDSFGAHDMSVQYVN